MNKQQTEPTKEKNRPKMLSCHNKNQFLKHIRKFNEITTTKKKIAKIQLHTWIVVRPIENNNSKRKKKLRKLLLKTLLHNKMKA